MNSHQMSQLKGTKVQIRLMQRQALDVGRGDAHACDHFTHYFDLVIAFYTLAMRVK